MVATIAEMGVFDHFEASKIVPKMMPFWIHFGPKMSSFWSPKSVHFGPIFGSKKKIIFELEIHFRGGKEISFRCRKTNFRPENKFFGPEKKMKFRPQFHRKSMILSQKEAKIGQNRLKIDDFWPFSAHFFENRRNRRHFFETGSKPAEIGLKLRFSGLFRPLLSQKLRF